MNKKNDKRFKRKLFGTVVSDKCDKTIVVSVLRRFKHPKYSKYVHVTKKFHAHDPTNIGKIGNFVSIIESAPHSKMKKWELFKVLK